MWRAALLPVLILVMVVCCTGQTFQYSRGWTNGKRSDTRPDTRSDESNDIIIDADWERKIEKCLYALQRVTQVPYLRNTLLAANRKMAGHRHVVADDIEDLADGGPFGTRLKRHVDGISA